MVRHKFLKDFLQYDLFLKVFCALYGLGAGFAIMTDQKLGLAVAIFPLFVWLILTDKKNLLYLFLLILPFQGSSYFSQNIMGIQGAKPFNLIAAISLITCFFYAKDNIYPGDEIGRKAFVFLGLYYAIFTVAFIRSFNYFPLIQIAKPSDFDSHFGYFLSVYVKAGFYTISFIYILIHVTSKIEIERTITIVNLSLTMLALSILLIALKYGTIFMERSSTSVIWGKTLGIHYNGLGTLLVFGAPLSLMQVSRGKIVGILGYCLGFLAILILQSRTSFLLYIMASCMYAIIKRKKYLVIGIFIITLYLFFFSIPDFLLTTLQTGIADNDIDINQLSSGRTDHLWMPLLYEMSQNPKFFLFGNGLYGIVATSSFQTGAILQTFQAHNAFIDFWIDCGFILLAVLIYYLVKFFLFSWRQLYRINNDIGWALFISIICYFISCITGRRLLPSTNTMMLYPIFALLINFLRLGNDKKVSS